MIVAPRDIWLDSADETARLATRIGARLVPGDCLLLTGPIGAGKTHFARHLIQSLLSQPEDIPSPTYTLVQTYDTAAGELWHADLYRLASPDEIEELGLAQAFDQAICLIEWAEKLDPFAPAEALRLSLSADIGNEARRHLILEWSASKWARILEPILNDFT